MQGFYVEPMHNRSRKAINMDYRIEEKEVIKCVGGVY